MPFAMTCRKHLILSIFLGIVGLSSSASAISDKTIQTADSLFEARMYIESFEIYDSLLQKEGTSSPKMLLKMAYIKEGLKDYAATLYYLSLLMKIQFDPSIEEKILALAREKSLMGYSESFSGTLKNMLDNIFPSLGWMIIAVVLIWGSFVLFSFFRNQKKKKFSPRVNWFLSFVLCAVLLFNYNFFFKKHAIIMENHALIMAGPSPGSTLITETSKGHKVKVLSNRDIWVQIQWGGKTAYIRGKSLQLL